MKAGKTQCLFAAFFSAAVLAAALFASPAASAKLVVFSPDKMIKMSDTILVGDVGDSSVKGKTEETTVTVRQVLKGVDGTKSVVLRTAAKPSLAGEDIRIPPEGTRIMVFMREGYLTADMYSAAVVKDGRAAVVESGAQGEAYSAAYTKLLQSKTPNSALKWGVPTAVALLAAGAAILLGVIKVRKRARGELKRERV